MPTLSNSLIAEVTQGIYDKAVTVFLVNEPVFDIVSASVGGYRPHPLNYYALTTEVVLDRVRVPASNVLGEVGRGSAKDPGGTVRTMMKRLGLR